LYIFPYDYHFPLHCQGFEEAVKGAATKGFDDASCELYKQIMIKTAWLAEKDLPGNIERFTWRNLKTQQPPDILDLCSKKSHKIIVTSSFSKKVRFQRDSVTLFGNFIKL